MQVPTDDFGSRNVSGNKTKFDTGHLSAPHKACTFSYPKQIAAKTAKPQLLELDRKRAKSVYAKGQTPNVTKYLVHDLTTKVERLAKNPNRK